MTLSCEHTAGFVAAGYGALFGLGLAGSLHCAGMCGPLSCVMGADKSLKGLSAYHLARLASYMALGALLWTIGAPLRLSLPWPWLLALLSLPLLGYAFAPSVEWPQALGVLHRAAYRNIKGLSPWKRGAGLGLLTPLLPCGLLYAAAGFSLAAPDAVTAALWMLAFAAGTFPLLLLSQAGWHLALAKSGVSSLARMRRAAAGLAALALLTFAFLEQR